MSKKSKRPTGTQTKVKKKKFWYQIIAPDIFQNVVIGDTTASEPASLLNRTVSLAYSSITNNPRDSLKKFKVRVTSTKGDKAHTEAEAIYYQNSFIQRVSKRIRERLLTVNNIQLKDKKSRIKLYLYANDKLARRVKTALQQRLTILLNEKLTKQPFVKLFEPNYLEGLTKELKKDLKPIYPIDHIKPWKVELIK